MCISSSILRVTSWMLVASMCGIFAACTDEGEGAEDTGDTGGNGNQETDAELSEPRIGGFDIQIVPQTPDGEAYASLTGKVYDAPQPEGVIWNKVDEEDGCVLYKPEVPFCNPPCSGGICTAEDVCTEEPTAKHVGKATFTGLKNADGAKKIVVEPFNDNNVYMSTVTLLYPPFDEGDTVKVETSGSDDFKSFTIETVGISQLKIKGKDEIPMENDQPLVVNWSAPEDENNARVELHVDISHHGGAKGKIDCDVPDTGTATISASLVTQLIDFGYSGWPAVDVTRIARGYVMLKRGRVELNTIARESRPLAIPGLVSCMEDGDCPKGQTCQQDMKCN